MNAHLQQATGGRAAYSKQYQQAALEKRGPTLRPDF